MRNTGNRQGLSGLWCWNLLKLARPALKDHVLRPPNCGEKRAQAFTRFELMVVLGALCLLAMLVLPALANGKAGSQRAVCASNLARIGRGLAMWGSERGDLLPWQVDAYAGGTRNHPSGFNANTWFNFAWASNELVTPKILACPSDRLAQVADNFGLGAEGLLNNQYQNNAISYSLSHPYPEDGRLVLSSDRNMQLDGGLSGGCGYFRELTYVSNNPSNSLWMDFIHVKSGNLLLNDGSVELTDNEGLRSAIGHYFPYQGDDRSSAPHFLFPRPSGLISEREN